MLVISSLLIASFATAGQSPGSEPGLTAARIAECDAVTKRLTDLIVSNPNWDPRDPIADEMNRCRSALQAHAVVLALAKRREPYQIEPAHVRSVTAIARDVVDTFNRDGLRANFRSLNIRFLGSFGPAIAAESCLAGANPSPASVAAAKQALQTFNRDGAYSAYPSSVRIAIEGCVDKSKDGGSNVAPSVIGAPAASQSGQSARRVTITGRLLYEDKSPIVGIHIMVMEAQSKDGKITTTWKTGADGKLANPSATTDKAGRFSIDADPAFWAGTGHFTLSGGFLPGTTTNAGILRGPGDVPMLLAVDDKTKRLELGDVIIKKR